MTNALNEKFYSLIKRDSGFIEDYMINWEYIDKSRKRKAHSEVVEASDFFQFNGKEDLHLWFQWLNYEQNSYLPASIIDPLIAESKETDRNVFQQLQLPFDYPLYERNIGLDNALDFHFPHFYPSPERYKVRNVLDFGAGFGRQAALYTRDQSDFNYIAMDAIPKSYCLQYTYFKALNRGVVDYLDDPENFNLQFQKKGFYHIPTWRYDLVPANSLDLIICVQVLPELSSPLIKKMVAEFSRMLKPGGMIYIRDHKEKWVPAGKVSKDAVLEKNGFVKEFEAHVINMDDIHGIPRIWRKKDELVVNSQARTRKEKLRQTFADADAMTGGLLSKINKTIGFKL